MITVDQVQRIIIERGSSLDGSFIKMLEAALSQKDFEHWQKTPWNDSWTEEVFARPSFQAALVTWRLTT